ELAAQNEDQDLKDRFTPIAQNLKTKEDVIFEEMNVSNGQAKDIGGYYRTDPEKVTKSVRRSATFNSILDSLN
ncbi:uncharacterized protein METZ01_LOCUS343639, partial [marine metagenome]